MTPITTHQLEHTIDRVLAQSQPHREQQQQQLHDLQLWFQIRRLMDDPGNDGQGGQGVAHVK